MQFFKDNLFYSSLIGIMVVVGGALIAMGFTGDAATDAQQAPFKTMSDQIGQLNSPPWVNKRVIAGRDRVVKRTRALLDRVSIDTARWSRGDGRGPYTPMILPKHEAGEKVGTIPAFPIDRGLYEKYDLPYYASDEYRKRMGEIFRRLHPGLPPTNAEIEEEAERLKKIEEENARLKKLQEDFERRKAAVEKGDDPVDDETGREPPNRGAEPPATGDPDQRGLEKGADAEVKVVDYATHGLNNMRLFKAGLEIKGKAAPAPISIFADSRSALDLIFAAARTRATDTDLWDAQLQLWIVGDIVDAIAGVNDTALANSKDASPTRGAAKAAPANKRTVPNSAVKRLITINVPRGYVFRVPGEADGGIIAPPPRRPSGPRRAAGTGPIVPMLMETGANNLTQRATSKQYEIKHYSFTVVMDLRYLPDLQKALLMHNQHTITNVTMTSVDVADNATNIYYYGMGEVMQVTIEGELLMLSDWTRGRWLKKELKWAKGLSPLMPAAVLREISETDPSALRQEDNDRMNSQK